MICQNYYNQWIYNISLSMSIYDSYDLYQIIGHGTTCTVKRAIRKENQQVFAAKLYQANLLSAKNEIQMLIKLDHPNIVNIYQIFEDQNQYMQGGQLYEYLGQKEMLTQYHIMQFIKTIIDAVRYCHQINIVHRDIKPENLLLTSDRPDGILKLADFGISKIFSDQLLTTNCGTPIYMAPEIWKGQPYDSKVDVWSIGIVMYYLLSGSHPFFGDVQTIGEKIIFDDLKFEDKVWNSISSKAIDLIRKLLQKDPMKRPSALEATYHIWFTSHINLPSPVTQDQSRVQINLYRNVNKIRRFNFKRKLKKSKKKIQSLSQQCQKISYPHLQFILNSKTEQIQIESQFYEPQLKNIQTDMQLQQFTFI